MTTTDAASGAAVLSGNTTTKLTPGVPQQVEATAEKWVQDKTLSFIETQFPVSRLSKESYKERKANNTQTLTGLGKWWGRKPLIMVRAVILGLLMPASDDPRKDRDVFLALLTMDKDGLWRRKRRNIPLKEVYQRLTSRQRGEWFVPETDPNRPKLKKDINSEAKNRLQRIVFDGLGYDDKLKWCDRPEHLDGPSPEAWKDINIHLGTSANSLPELVRELGKRRFGHVPRVGDAFCGGGSTPFEAARLGCEAYGSDLNPVAALLTWGALNIVGGGEEVAEEVRRAQAEVFDAVDRQITEWRIEHNDVGWRADAFLYCTETKCPECGWLVPLAPSWVIGEKTRAIARLLPNQNQRRFDVEILSGADPMEVTAAKEAGTVKDSRLECPNPDCGCSTPITVIRGDQWGIGAKGYGLRRWENEDLVPRPEDVFQERLFCVRWRLPLLGDLLWAEQKARDPNSFDDGNGATGADGQMAPIPKWVDLEEAIEALAKLLQDKERRELAALRARDWTAENRALVTAQHEFDTKKSTGFTKSAVTAAREQVRTLKETIVKRDEEVAVLAKSLPSSLYQPVDKDDLKREAHVLTLVRERFEEWQANGYIPSRLIVPGYNTDQVVRERGWTHWHHLFSTRQLLKLGSMMCKSFEIESQFSICFQVILWVAKCAERNARIQGWDASATVEKASHVFTNQALNTQYVIGVNAHEAMRKVPFVNLAFRNEGYGHVEPCDARSVQTVSDVWITDPPYADAINYHELSGFFLSWYEKHIHLFFPNWYTDSKDALAVRGVGSNFRRSMVDCYSNLAEHMPDNGFQIVLFTHQDASVWADLTLILWAAGLRVTGAWTIATETESAYKKGNYVQGTVLMVLRKQSSEESVFLDEVVPDVELEVKAQLDSMLALDDQDDPNFSDADYQLAAYAAALRVLTRYGSIEDIDIAYQLSREQGDGESNPIEAVIEDAVRTASNYLVPTGLPDHLWRRLGPEEKLYLKGLEVESHGDYRSGVYQEFARGFGVRDYRFMLQTGKANDTRLKTASEFQRRELGDTQFGQSLVRHALYATWRAAESEEVAGSLTWLRIELDDYWPQRESLISVLRYLSAVKIDHWDADADAARLVAGAVENDHV